MKKLIGKVVSTKNINTVVITFEKQRMHPLYKKIMRKTVRMKAHCEDIGVKVGDMVTIVSCRPMSADKHFKVVKVI